MDLHNLYISTHCAARIFQDTRRFKGFIATAQGLPTWMLSFRYIFEPFSPLNLIKIGQRLYLVISQ
jgi:hypothetical protein